MSENLIKLSRYIGAPYDHFSVFGFNCWSFIAAVYHDLFNENLAEFALKTGSPREISSVFTSALATGEHRFKPVKTAQDFDIILFRGKVLHHCGLMIDGRVIHCTLNGGGVVIQDLSIVERDFIGWSLWRK